MCFIKSQVTARGKERIERRETLEDLKATFKGDLGTTESEIQAFLARGGEIKKCKKKAASGSSGGFMRWSATDLKGGKHLMTLVGKPLTKKQRRKREKAIAARKAKVVSGE